MDAWRLVVVVTLGALVIGQVTLYGQFQDHKVEFDDLDDAHLLLAKVVGKHLQEEYDRGRAEWEARWREQVVRAAGEYPYPPGAALYPANDDGCKP